MMVRTVVNNLEYRVITGISVLAEVGLISRGTMRVRLSGTTAVIYYWDSVPNPCRPQVPFQLLLAKVTAPGGFADAHF